MEVSCAMRFTSKWSRDRAALAAALILLPAVSAAWGVRMGRERPGRDALAAFAAEEAASRPSQVLARAISELAVGDRDRFRTRFSRPDEAERILADLTGLKLPAGPVNVAMADDLDAGAENGHRVPVTIWIDGAETTAGLRGEVSFQSEAGHFKLARLRLSPLPLAVRTWSEAARQIGRPGLVRSGAPFYGRYRFVGGPERWSVDALTGDVD